MTIELMDGATGSKHISSEDWTVFNEATYGASECVFDWGNKFKLTMSTANAGTLATGAGLVDGKRVWIKSPESITVTSGSQGMKRNDIVGIQYETYTSNSATLERPVVKVVKGTPDATTAADPSIPDKFLALWRVPLDGISVGTPVALFDVMESIKGFRDSVSQAAASKGWTVKRRPDGYAECVRQVSFKSNFTTAYGSLYRSSDYMASMAYPVTFKDVPLVTIGCYSNTTIMSAADGGTKTAAPNVYAVYPSRFTRENNIVICVKAEGYTA